MGTVMTDIFERIDELRELQKLYNDGDLRNFDFETRIQRLEREIEQFEAQYDFFDD